MAQPGTPPPTKLGEEQLAKREAARKQWQKVEADRERFRRQAFGHKESTWKPRNAPPAPGAACDVALQATDGAPAKIKPGTYDVDHYDPRSKKMYHAEIVVGEDNTFKMSNLPKNKRERMAGYRAMFNKCGTGVGTGRITFDFPRLDKDHPLGFKEAMSFLQVAKEEGKMIVPTGKFKEWADKLEGKEKAQFDAKIKELEGNYYDRLRAAGIDPATLHPSAKSEGQTPAPTQAEKQEAVKQEHKEGMDEIKAGLASEDPKVKEEAMEALQEKVDVLEFDKLSLGAKEDVLKVDLAIAEEAAKADPEAAGPQIEAIEKGLASLNQEKEALQARVGEVDAVIAKQAQVESLAHYDEPPPEAGVAKPAVIYEALPDVLDPNAGKKVDPKLAEYEHGAGKKSEVTYEALPGVIDANAGKKMDAKLGSDEPSAGKKSEVIYETLPPKSAGDRLKEMSEQTKGIKDGLKDTGNDLAKKLEQTQQEMTASQAPTPAGPGR